MNMKKVCVCECVREREKEREKKREKHRERERVREKREKERGGWNLKVKLLNMCCQKAIRMSFETMSWLFLPLRVLECASLVPRMAMMTIPEQFYLYSWPGNTIRIKSGQGRRYQLEDIYHWNLIVLVPYIWTRKKQK